MYEGRLSEVENRESIEEIGLRMTGETPTVSAPPDTEFPNDA